MKKKLTIYRIVDRFYCQCQRIERDFNRIPPVVINYSLTIIYIYIYIYTENILYKKT